MLTTIFAEIPGMDNYIGSRKIFQKPVFAMGVRKGKEVHELNGFWSKEASFNLIQILHLIITFSLIIPPYTLIPHQ